MMVKRAKLREKMNFNGIFLIVIFAVGILTVFPYGAHLDQDSEQKILYSNIKVYAHLFGDANPLYRELDGAGITEITESIEKDHGMAVFYPMAWIFMLNKISPFAGNVFWHGYIFVLSFCGIAALYLFLADVFGRRIVSAGTTLLLFFTPRMFAEFHYNNKDIILLALVLCIIFWGWGVYRKKTWGSVILFALTGSLAANMKIIGAFIWGMAGIYIFIALLIKRQIDKSILIKMAAGILIWFGVYFLITPACWTGLLEFWQYLLESAQNFRWNDYILFDGKMYNKNITGMPKRYLPVMILFTVPIGILLLAGIGTISSFFTLFRSRCRNVNGVWYLLTMEAACLIPLGYAVFSGTPVYNGWRHFYFAYAAVMLLAAQGISWLSDQCANKKGERVLTYSFGVYILALAAGIAIAYPHEYAYYNILAGQNVAERYELDYWDMSFKEAYEKILSEQEEGSNSYGIIKIGTISNPAYWGLEAQLAAIRGKRRMYVELCADFREAEYVIVNPMYALMYGASDYEYVKENYILMEAIMSYGNVICEIYQK